MALTESQIYALNSLTYAGFDAEAAPHIGETTADTLMQQAVDQEWTVGEYVQALQSEFGEHSSKFDATFDAILTDPTVSSMRIESHQHMEGSDANMIVFTSDSQSEAVVAFQGSQSGADWFDNFAVVQGDTGTADGVSSEFQVAANDYINSPEVQAILSEYGTVTTTGHSKGGNNATYCAVMNDGVDRSITFDAPGFTDAFYEKYGDRIAQKQDSVNNYSADSDIVNVLLNSIGQQHYIARELPDGYDDCIDAASADFQFMRGHDPTVMENYFFGGEGEVAQDPGAAALDRFANSLLREHPESADALFKFVDELANGDGLRELKEADNIFEKIDAVKALAEEIGPDVAQVLGFLMVYMEEYPEDVQAMIDMLARYNPELADTIVSFIDAWNSGWMAALRHLFLKDFEADAEQRYSDGIISGEDRRVSTPSGSGTVIASSGSNEKIFNTETYRDLARRLNRLNDDLQSCRGDIDRAADMCDKVDFRLSLSMTAMLLSAFKTVLSGTAEHILHGISSRVGACASELDDLADKMRRAASAIEDSEDKLTAAAAAIRAQDDAPHANA